jgi:hypothetical protein
MSTKYLKKIRLKVLKNTYIVVMTCIFSTQITVYAETNLPTTQNTKKESTIEVIKPKPMVMPNTRPVTAKVSIPLVEGKQPIPVLATNNNNKTNKENKYVAGNFAVIQNQKSTHAMPVKNSSEIKLSNDKKTVPNKEATPTVVAKKIGGIKIIENGAARTEYHQPTK